MKRIPAPEILERCAEIEHAVTCCYCTVKEPRDKTQALAMLLLAVELAEALDYSHDQIRGALESVLAAPLRTDPRADTTGT